MGPLLGETELSKALIEAGNNLLKPHSSTDVILSLLDEFGSLLSTIEQSPTESVQRALLPSMEALVSADLLRNPDSDVRVFVVSCFTEIMRITAPDTPYNDDQMKEIFQATVEAFGKLADASCRSYRKAEIMLETVAKMKSSLVMLNLEFDDLVLEMFRQFLKTISPDHPQPVLLSMETVMITVIDESVEVSMDLLEILLTAVKKESQDVSPTASRLVEKVLRICVRKLQPCIVEALRCKETSLDKYSPVVLSLFHSESAITQVHNVVNAKENEDKLEVGLSRKGNRTKRTARGGIHRLNGDDKARTGNDLNQLLKIGQSESTDAETESGSTEKRRWKPNSLKNPEEGYSFKTPSSNKMQDKGIGDSSVEKLVAKKVSLPTKVGQTDQSVSISLSPSSKARTGARKRSRTKMEEISNDVGSIATPLSKKQILKKDNPGEDLKEPNLEQPEDSIKTAKSSRKERAQNGLVKTSAKKPVAETKMAKTSAKKSFHSDVKKNNSEGASMNTPIPHSSKRKESNTNELGKELVGKKVNVWCPLDQKFHEGVIVSYSSHMKSHLVSYTDGDAEELNLKKERFEIIQDDSSANEKPKASMMLQRCENEFKARKLNDIVEEDIAMRINSNNAHDYNLLPEPEGEETQRISAKSKLYSLCGMRHWKAPVYECCGEEGPDHMKLFTVKATIEIKEDSRVTVLECFGERQLKKKIAAEKAAEAALWYLKNVGHVLQTKKAPSRGGQTKSLQKMMVTGGSV